MTEQMIPEKQLIPLGQSIVEQVVASEQLVTASFHVGTQTKVLTMLGVSVDCVKDGIRLGSRDEDSDWSEVRDGTVGGAGTNGRINLVASSFPKSPPRAINSPFDVTL